MALPGMPVGTFRAYGEVVRVSARSGKDSGLFDVAVKFLNISETERDQLIACSFAAQRRSIRNASEDADDQ
jgi:c-di-GMP-binding flagellar brake protein YcgR